MDIYLVEAMINGILLGGVLALLALGLNLVFGVVDVVWICYAELVMCGMYAIYWLHIFYGWPILLACLVAIVGVAALGLLLHLVIISPILGSAPINQLLATGAILLYLFLAKTYLGVAIRAIAQDREIMGLMGVDQRRIYLITSAIGGALAGLAACLLVLQYDVHPFIGLSFGPITFMICVLGGLGNMIGGFVAAFIMSQIISIGGFYFSQEIGEVLAFVVFIALIFVRPQGIFGRS